MPEYLSKEEVRQWRSSLEKITLEEFARRLGKVINEEKNTNDVVDKVMNDIKFTNNNVKEEYQTRIEKINVIAQAAIDRERDIINNYKPKTVTKSQQKSIEEIAQSILPKAQKEDTKAKVSEIKQAEKVEKVAKTAKVKKDKKVVEQVKTTKQPKVTTNFDEEFPVVLKKAFTNREQVVFDYLLAHRKTVVFAKDLAELLGLPRDYIYKYIKGIRAKMQQDVLSNAQKGGFVLNV